MPMTANQPKHRIPVQVQLEAKLAEKARIHRAKTGESVSDLVNRLLRSFFAKSA